MAKEKTNKKSVNDFRRLNRSEVNKIIFNVLDDNQYIGSLDDGNSKIEPKGNFEGSPQNFEESPLCHFFLAGQNKKCAVFSVTHDVELEVDSSGGERKIPFLKDYLSQYKTYIDSNELPARNLFIPLIEKKWKEAHLTLLQITLSEDGKRIEKVTLFDPKGKIPRCFYPKDHIKQAIKEVFGQEIKFEEYYLGWQGITDTVSCGDKSSSLIEDIASSFNKDGEEKGTLDEVRIGDTLKNVKKEIIDEEANFLFKFLYKLFGVPEEKVIEKLRAQRGIDVPTNIFEEQDQKKDNIYDWDVDGEIENTQNMENN